MTCSILTFKIKLKKTILIADDSDSVRELVCFTPENAGYKDLSGRDGEDALKNLTGETIDLVLTDLHMPNLDGVGLIKQGLLEMKQAGAKTIAQNEKSCVVFGLSKEAIKLNAADKILPLDQIANHI